MPGPQWPVSAWQPPRGPICVVLPTGKPRVKGDGPSANSTCDPPMRLGIHQRERNISWAIRPIPRRHGGLSPQHLPLPGNRGGCLLLWVLLFGPSVSAGEPVLCDRVPCPESLLSWIQKMPSLSLEPAACRSCLRGFCLGRVCGYLSKPKSCHFSLCLLPAVIRVKESGRLFHALVFSQIQSTFLSEVPLYFLWLIDSTLQSVGLLVLFLFSTFNACSQCFRYPGSW